MCLRLYLRCIVCAFASCVWCMPVYVWILCHRSNDSIVCAARLLFCCCFSSFRCWPARCLRPSISIMCGWFTRARTRTRTPLLGCLFFVRSLFWLNARQPILIFTWRVRAFINNERTRNTHIRMRNEMSTHWTGPKRARARAE